ncbi:helix-turn-helix domain-containing protein [uncultured Microbulbifer sp.]|uniref:MarR family transcriptional regulator n=1 Tax=uncultured Microbulbifer sp. TaxID=348147 RepID=UPI0026038A94|nr:helix-turn-helix domain-containing protein [uncultured Microbulbifer sp.]
MVAMPPIKTGQALDWGNRCGHIPDMPDLSLRFPANGGTIGKDGKRRGNIPSILLKLLKRLEQYYWKPSIIPSLNIANKSLRQQRSERREGCMKILAAMIKHTDLTTLKVGTPHPSGEFRGMTIPYLASEAGISFYRASRAIKDLERSGLVTIATRAEPDGEGGYRGIAAVKAIKKQLFAIFGLEVPLKYERKSASERQKEKKKTWEAEQRAQKGTRAGMARVVALINGLLGPDKKKYSREPVGTAESIEVQKNRAKAVMLRKLLKERPELTHEEIYQLIKNESS